MKNSAPKKGATPSELIDARIADLGDWRGAMLSALRGLIKEAEPEVEEEWKWRGTPVWSHNGMICTGESYKTVVKMTFAKGAALHDPSGLFNSSMEGNVRRAIDFHQGEKLNKKALKALIRAAVDLNAEKARPKIKQSSSTKASAKKASAKKASAKKASAKKASAKKASAKKARST